MSAISTRLIAAAAAFVATGWCAGLGQAAAGGPLASLENPQPGSFQSGIGLLSGWSCTGPDVSMVVDGRLVLAMPYGSARTDTASVCGAGNTNTGFGLLVNFNTLGPGTHTAALLINGVNAGTTQFVVTVPESEFMTGASRDVVLSDFPTPGKSAVLTWQQSQQNFAVKLVGDAATVTATATTTTTTANAATTTTTTATGATTTTTAGSDALEGGRLFTTYCVCHTPADEVGRNSNEIHDAIVKDLGGMAILDFLTDRQISQIGLYLSLEELHPDHGN